MRGDYSYVHGYIRMQLDDFRQQLVDVEADCDPNTCDFHPSATRFGTSETQQLHSVYTKCYPGGDECYNPVHVEAMRFDPAAPDDRALVLISDGTSGYRIDSIDLATGAITPVVDIQGMLGSLRLGRIYDFSVDAEKQRVLLTASGFEAAYPTPDRKVPAQCLPNINIGMLVASSTRSTTPDEFHGSTNTILLHPVPSRWLRR